MNSSKVLLCVAALAFTVVSGVKFIAPTQVLTTESQLAQALGAAAGTEFEKVQTKDGITRWRQQVNSIPVYDSVVTTHENPSGQINEVYGFISETANLVDTNPEIDGVTALQTLKSEWRHLPSQYLKFRDDDPELQVLPSDDGFDKLVYLVSYFVDQVDRVNPAVFDTLPGNVSLPAYIKGLVNAHTGEIERTWNDIQFNRVQQWGVVGNRNTGASYELMSVEKAGYWDCRHRDLDARITVFNWWNRREWTNYTTDLFQCRLAGSWDWDRFTSTGAYSPRNEAFVNARKFLQLWDEVVGDEITPFRTDTSPLDFHVHYGQNFENAFFDGISFYFGDGYRNYYPMMTLDILCHEVGHGITSWKGGRMEYRIESGGINEAYSDILGETCDMRFKNKNDYLIGKEIARPGNTWGIAWRNMCDPPSIGGSYGALDHYSQYRDNIDVHRTSGIYNKAWCLLTKTSGWDYLKAFEVFTDANLMYWKPTITMHCGACGVERAAQDKGYNSNDVTSVFNTVGVSCAQCQQSL